MRKPFAYILQNVETRKISAFRPVFGSENDFAELVKRTMKTCICDNASIEAFHSRYIVLSISPVYDEFQRFDDMEVGTLWASASGELVKLIAKDEKKRDVIYHYLDCETLTNRKDWWHFQVRYEQLLDSELLLMIIEMNSEGE